MKILLTGATGSLGKVVLEDLLSLGHEVLTLGKTHPDISHSKHLHITFDFRKDSKLDLSFIPDAIIHMAGIVRGQAKDETEYQKVNVQSTELLVNLASKCNSKFIYTSSASVYGDGLDLKENSPLKGSSFYAKSKISAEKLIESKLENFVIFRVASAFGKGTQSFIHKLYHYGKLGFLPYPAKAKQLKKTFVHAKDVSYFITKSLALNVKGVFNLAHPKILTYPEILEIIEKKLTLEKRTKPIKIYIPKTIGLIEKKLRKLKGKDSLLSPLFESCTLNIQKLLREFNEHPKNELTTLE
ncbi:MAG: SDR family oxidoreductase [Leptospiraceae bacterium]|nr:SDR family oxidoreductase [Leptospiraceae bacterium]